MNPEYDTFVQIASHYDHSLACSIVTALDDEGSVWVRTLNSEGPADPWPGCGSWIRLFTPAQEAELEKENPTPPGEEVIY